MKRVFAIVLIAFGLATLNYTEGSGRAHHLERATELGIPAPSRTIFFAGAAVTVLGSYLLGRRSGQKSS